MIALVVLLMICCAMLSVFVLGLPYLPASIQARETLFSIRLSFFTAAVSTTLCMLLAVPCAYALTRSHIPAPAVVEALLQLTACLPYIVMGLCLLILFSSPWGKALKAAGFPVVFHQNGIIMAQLFVNLPFALRMVCTAFQQVDSRYEAIAGMLGASRWHQLTTILLPLCKNELVSTIVLVWSRAMGEFGATLMLVGVTRMKTETLPGSIYLHISTGCNEAAMASAILMMSISFLALLCSNLLARPPRYYRLQQERQS